MATSRRFDWVPLVLMLVFGAVLGAAYLRWQDPPRHQALLRAYGRSHWSYGVEEWIVRDFFQDRRGGVFLDIGSANARTGSNTYFLESQLGWSGIAVDALTEYAEGYRTYRPRTKFFNLFVSDVTDAEATIYVNDRVTSASSVDKNFTATHSDGRVTPRKMPTITINDLLTQAKVDRIDFVSLDIELSELTALKGFDLNKYRPALFCVEAQKVNEQNLINEFARRGYVVVGKYRQIDAENLWFMPLPSLPAS